MPKHEGTVYEDTKDVKDAKDAKDAKKPWTQEEELGLLQAIERLALAHCPDLARSPEIQHRGPSKTNVKIHGLFRKFYKAYGTA